MRVESKMMMGTYYMLDLTPKGRDEHDGFYKMDWVRHHDRYETAFAFTPAPEVASCCSAKA